MGEVVGIGEGKGIVTLLEEVLERAKKGDVLCVGLVVKSDTMGVEVWAKGERVGYDVLGGIEILRDMCLVCVRDA